VACNAGKVANGPVNLVRALQVSSDVYFYQLGLDMNPDRRLPLQRWAKRLGLGRTTGIDVPGEGSGLVPDPAWSLAVRKMPWYPGETISVAIGQGPVLLTPLQMAMMLAAVANGGHRVTPHLILGMRLPEPEQIALDPHALEVVRRGLWAVVNEPGGTGSGARVAGADIAGKTGTVQVIAQKQRTEAKALPFALRDHGWFSSFAPADDPRIVVVVFAEHGGSGSRGAAPIAQAIYEKYFAVDRNGPVAR